MLKSGYRKVSCYRYWLNSLGFTNYKDKWQVAKIGIGL